MEKKCSCCGTSQHNVKALYCWNCGNPIFGKMKENAFVQQLERMKKIELESMKKDRKYGIPVRINPNSYVAKELFYQTILLKQLKTELDSLMSIVKKNS